MNKAEGTANCLIFGQIVTLAPRFIHRRTHQKRYAFVMSRPIRESARRVNGAEDQAGMRLR